LPPTSTDLDWVIPYHVAGLSTVCFKEPNSKMKGLYFSSVADVRFGGGSLFSISPVPTSLRSLITTTNGAGQRYFTSHTAFEAVHLLLALIPAILTSFVTATLVRFSHKFSSFACLSISSSTVIYLPPESRHFRYHCLSSLG
jgi:hypothetical protein